MLAGEAVVAIWNDITDEGRAEFYAWHLHEHMAERTGIPGFIRGRRYAALQGAPEFFTLYEARTMGVLQGSDYLARLNAPSAWTRTATAGFRNTFRALAAVAETRGPGGGGVVLTLRFDAPPTARESLAALARDAAHLPRITGAHLCWGDAAASGERTAESADRSDLQVPPAWFAVVEATDAAALDDALTDAALAGAGASSILRGCYRLEFIRGKTAWT